MQGKQLIRLASRVAPAATPRRDSLVPYAIVGVVFLLLIALTLFTGSGRPDDLFIIIICLSVSAVSLVTGMRVSKTHLTYTWDYWDTVRSSGDTEPAMYCRGKKCGYDLRGLHTLRCPECGRRFHPANPRSYRSHPPGYAFRQLPGIARWTVIILTLLFLVLAITWGCFWWGWYSERRALIALKLDPCDPRFVRYTPILTYWPKDHLGPAGFVMDRVWYVSLNRRTDVTDFTPLARLAHLEALYLGGTPVADLTPLTNLTQMEVLDLTDTAVSDITPLGGLTRLQTLFLTGTRVTDHQPLARVAHLHSLYLNGVPIADLTPLPNLTQMEVLDLKGKPVSNITPLGGHTHLQTPIIKGTGLEKNPEAVNGYRKAEQGDAEAQIGLGSCNEIGTGAEKDPVEAVMGYRKAPEQGAKGQKEIAPP